MNKFKIAVGDWSGDGHSQFREYTVETTMDKEDILKSYLQTVEETGLTLSDYFYPPSFKGCGIGKDGQIKGKEILSDYEGYRIDQDDAMTLWEAGYTFGYESEEEFKEALDYEEGMPLGPQETAELYVWFVTKNRPNETMRFIDEKMDYLVGFWRTHALGSIGYGVLGC